MSSAEVAAAVERLNEEIRACTRCDLCRTATQAVPGEGALDATVMLVGEGPGFNEDKQGRPFVGAAGRFLNELLGEAGLRREDVFITNIVKHRPPNNRDPDPAEVEACFPWLDQQLALIRPRIVMTLGRFAMERFLTDAERGGKGISKIHGQVFEKDGRYVIPLFHPAAALHQERWRPDLIEDMRRLREMLQGRLARPPESADGEEDNPEQLSLFGN